MSSRWMRKKVVWLLVILVAFFNVFWVNVTYVEAARNTTTQPEVCNWPSEMMQTYFNFQHEIKSVLFWSQVDERRFYASAWEWWLFTRGSLKLPSVLDFVASNLVWNVKSSLSTAGTSIVLLLLTSASVFQSNTEWFAILFKDRPIVRDYKTMLDIETEWFDVAYFRSKQINLTLKLEWKEIYDNVNKVIEKYQWLWLLSKWGKLKWTESMADIIEEMIWMNTAMKHFILFWWSPWDRALRNYNWCFWNLSIENCKDAPVLKFNPKAIEQLKKDYSWLWTFGACNLYLSNFKSTISKSLDNNLDSVKIAFKDVKDAMKRLNSALIWDLANGKDNSKTSSRCDISDYELAQLKAYWGAEWECWKVIDVSAQIPSLQILKTSDYLRNRNSQNDQRKKSSGLMKKSARNLLQDVDANQYEVLAGKKIFVDELMEIENDGKREQKWKEKYWETTEYKPAYKTEYLDTLAKNFVGNYEQVMGDYYQSQWNASSSDFADKMKKIRWLIDQVDAAMVAAKALNSELVNIADYQCP